MTAARGSIIVRNCILQLLPSDLVAKAEAAAKIANRSDDLLAKIPHMVSAFAVVNVPAEQLEGYLGKDLLDASVEDLASLREIYQSIKAGNDTWSSYYSGAE